jgi:hypothetical protein
MNVRRSISKFLEMEQRQLSDSTSCQSITFSPPSSLYAEVLFQAQSGHSYPTFSAPRPVSYKSYLKLLY